MSNFLKQSVYQIIRDSLWNQRSLDILAFIAIQSFFWSGQLYDWDLPGLYMDAVNPDFLAARTINPQLPNPVGAMPTALFPVLGNFYHGVQNYYAGLPIFLLLGFSLLSLRIAQGLFGAGIVTLVYLITKRITKDRLIGLLSASGLATELAFIGSFRTQFYIVISGAFWLLAAIYFALPSEDASERNISTRSTLSGLCAGLSVYGYFVYLFFLPAFLALILYNTRNFRIATRWVLGFVLGMTTYVIGYALAFIQLGGIANGLDWIANFLRAIEHQNSSRSLMERISWSYELFKLAMINAGNEYMIFDYGIMSLWASRKLDAFIFITLFGFLFVYWQKFGRKSVSHDLIRSEQLVWFIFSFFLCITIFEKQVWIHHFSSLLPLFYLIAGLMFGYMLKQLHPRWTRYLLFGTMTFLVASNISQQQRFFEELELTGGRGKWGDSINKLASDAVLHSPGLTHVFPEWGFYMSFAFLTANKVAYTTDASTHNLKQLSNRGETVRLYFWKKEDEKRYSNSLIGAGFVVTASGSYVQRDNSPSFYWIQGKN